MPHQHQHQLQRRLSARRGSVTAPDPYGAHASINDAPNRTSQSKLTIVRVLSPPPPPPHLPPSPNAPTLSSDAPSSPSATSNSFSLGLAHSLSSRRRRPGSVGSLGSIGGGGANSPPAADSPPPGRLSFAFSSFGPSSDGASDHHRSAPGGSPTSSPRLRPAPGSPRLAAVGPGYVGAHHHNYGVNGKMRLTPDQLVDLARQATDPRTLAQIASHSTSTSTSNPHSTFTSTTATTTGVSPGASPSPGSPILRPHTPSIIAPATFTPLPDDIYLPFIDRPGEVAALISSVPDAKLFALLAQTLPKVYVGPAYGAGVLGAPGVSEGRAVGTSTGTGAEGEPGAEGETPALSTSVSTTSSSAPLTSPSPFSTFPPPPSSSPSKLPPSPSPASTSTSTPASTSIATLINTLPPDPAHWTHTHLLTHLTLLDRDAAPDPVWVAAARRCIRTHSELIWERVKGGLGVPPELDGDAEWDWDWDGKGKGGYQGALERSTGGEGVEEVWVVGDGGGMRRRGSRGSHHTHRKSTSKRERTDSVKKMGERMRRLRAELREGAPKRRLGMGGGEENESALDDEEHDDDVGVPEHVAKRWGGLQKQKQPEGESGTATPTRERPFGTEEGGRTAFAHRTPAQQKVQKEEDAGGMVIGEFSEDIGGDADDVGAKPEVRVQVTRPSGDDVGSASASASAFTSTAISTTTKTLTPASAEQMVEQTVEQAQIQSQAQDTLDKDRTEHEDLDASSFEELYSEGELEERGLFDDDDGLISESDDEARGGGGLEDDLEGTGLLEIEPILAPSSDACAGNLASANAPPPLSQGTKELLEAGVATDVPAAEGVGLGDIMEGEEEEEEEDEDEEGVQGAGDGKGGVQGEGKEVKEDVGAEGAEGPTKEGGEENQDETDLIDPAQIQGLRISTAPVHAAGWYGAGGGLYVPHHAVPHAAPVSPGGLADNHGFAASPMPIGDGEEREVRTLAGGGDAASLSGGSAGLSSSTSSLQQQGQQYIINPPLGGQRSHSRTSSFSSLSGVSIGPFKRTESSGSLAKESLGVGHGLYGSYGAGYHPSHGSFVHGSIGSIGSAGGIGSIGGGGSAYGSDVDGYGSDWSAGATQGSVVGVHRSGSVGGGGGGGVGGRGEGVGGLGGMGGGGEEKVGDRKPGEPLFVSNFARLNGCPTLSGQGSQHGQSKGKRFRVKRGAREGHAPPGASVQTEKFLGVGGRSV